MVLLNPMVLHKLLASMIPGDPMMIVLGSIVPLALFCPTASYFVLIVSLFPLNLIVFFNPIVAVGPCQWSYHWIKYHPFRSNGWISNSLSCAEFFRHIPIHWNIVILKFALSFLTSENTWLKEPDIIDIRMFCPLWGQSSDLLSEKKVPKTLQRWNFSLQLS